MRNRFVVVKFFLLMAVPYLQAQVTVVSSFKINAPHGKMGARLVVEDYVLMIDASNSSIGVYNKRGEYLHSFGRKGVGPGEMLSPLKLDYDKGKLIVSDTGRQGFHVFGFNEGMISDPVFVRTGSAINAIGLKDNQVIIIGHQIYDYRMWWACSRDLDDQTDSIKPLVSYSQLWGLKNDTEVRKVYRQKKLLNYDSYCASNGDFLFACETRNLRIVRYDFTHGTVKRFGNHGKYYKDVEISEDKIKDIMNRRDSVALLKEYNKLFLMNGLVATPKFVYLLYKTPQTQSGYQYILQKYHHNGVFVNDYSLTEKMKYGQDVTHYFGIQSNKTDDVLFLSEHTEDENGEALYFIHEVLIK